MTMPPNRNRPRKGRVTKVEPIRTPEGIRAIKELLRNQPRNYCLFTLGINSTMKVSELTEITVRQVKNLRPGGKIRVNREGKKTKAFPMNNTCVQATRMLLASSQYENDDVPLMQGQRGKLTLPTINRLVKEWCAAVNLSGNYGSHTLRKTFGYHQRVRYGVDLTELKRIFCHATRRQTQRYLCLTEENKSSLYANEI